MNFPQPDSELELLPRGGDGERWASTPKLCLPNILLRGRVGSERVLQGNTGVLDKPPAPLSAKILKCAKKYIYVSNNINNILRFFKILNP